VSLNVKRVAFRLWIAFSAIWVIVMAWLLYPMVYDHASRLASEQTFEEEYERALKGKGLAGHWTMQQKDVLAYARARAAQSGNLPLIRFTFVFRDTKEPKVASVYVSLLGVDKGFVADTSPTAIWQEYKPLITRAKFYRFLKATLVVLAPPIGLLAFGLLIAWIFRGFASTKVDSEQ